MKKYRVNVNGTSYEVEIELVSETETAANKEEKAVSFDAAGEQVTSPMPGTILDVKVKTGDSVKKGQVLLVLEAMKMENEIMASADGTVASVAVSKGASVGTGDLLLVIK